MKIGDKSRRQRKGFPQGCDSCPDKESSDCWEDCEWPVNYWKYEEVKWFWMLCKAQAGGMDLNRIETLTIDDFVKIGIIKEYIDGTVL